jgi:hypothetical protein
MFKGEVLTGIREKNLGQLLTIPRQDTDAFLNGTILLT